ncbi:MAG: DUF58 domain-containing protein [Haloplanus sp.]
MFGVRPTRRGIGVASVAVAGAAMSVTFGPRSLDAVVLPAVVALVAAGVQLTAFDPPHAEREPPPPGDPDTTGTVTLTLATDTPATAVVYDRLPPGLDGDARVTALVGDDAPPITYTVTYRERGDHGLGPARVHARDVLGLAERTFVAEGDGSVLVYPRVFRPSAAVSERLRALSTPAATAERGAFDHLREYARGDSLRDVHWKSSAKRDDLVVQEFTEDGDRRTVTVAASADAGRADPMAEAAASVGYALLAEGARVALTTPGGRTVLEPGDTDRLLAHLARVGAGHVTTRDVDVHVDAGIDGTEIRIDGERLPFDPGRRRRVGDTRSEPNRSSADRRGVRA